MAYVLEKISKSDQEKILRDFSSNERILGFMKMRGGHFNNNPTINWAIDRDLNSYVFWAPKPAMSKEYYYCYFYEGVVYIIYVESLASQKIIFDEKSPPPNPIELRMKNSIRSALAVHGVFGVAGDRPLVPVFDGEE